MIGETYLRQCESQESAQLEITKKLLIHGTTSVNLPPILCSADGSYGAYKIGSGRAFCVWRDNTNIGSFVETDMSKLNQMNCSK